MYLKKEGSPEGLPWKGPSRLVAALAGVAARLDREATEAQTPCARLVIAMLGVLTQRHVLVVDQTGPPDVFDLETEGVRDERGGLDVKWVSTELGCIVDSRRAETSSAADRCLGDAVLVEDLGERTLTGVGDCGAFHCNRLLR